MRTTLKMSMTTGTLLSAAALAILLGATAFGQSKTLTGKTQVITGTV